MLGATYTTIKKDVHLREFRSKGRVRLWHTEARTYEKLFAVWAAVSLRHQSCIYANTNHLLSLVKPPKSRGRHTRSGNYRGGLGLLLTCPANDRLDVDMSHTPCEVGGVETLVYLNAVVENVVQHWRNLAFSQGYQDSERDKSGFARVQTT